MGGRVCVSVCDREGGGEREGVRVREKVSGIV